MEWVYNALLTVFITIVYTFVFSVVNVINTYNNSINTLIDEEFLEYIGYNPKLIYQALEQNLYSGMWFYIWGAFLMGAVVLMFLFFASVRIRSNNLKNEFYSDYIMIVQEIIEEQKSGKAEMAEEGKWITKRMTLKKYVFTALLFMRWRMEKY